MIELVFHWIQMEFLFVIFLIIFGLFFFPGEIKLLFLSDMYYEISFPRISFFFFFFKEMSFFKLISRKDIVKWWSRAYLFFILVDQSNLTETFLYFFFPILVIRNLIMWYPHKCQSYFSICYIQNEKSFRKKVLCLH